MNTIEQFNQHVMGSYGRFDLVLEKGEDRTATDEDGKQYTDFGSGIGTNSLGYCNDKWVDVINNVNSALKTGYYNGKLYFFRAFAYESLGYYKNAKKDYKVAKKNGVFEANAALVRIKQKMKAKR